MSLPKHKLFYVTDYFILDVLVFITFHVLTICFLYF